MKSRETIFMIHCTWGRGSFWSNYIDFFSSHRYRCLSPDWLYHDQAYGEEPDSRLGTTSLLEFTKDFENQIKKLDQKPILMGHSVGGLIAQKLSSRDLCKALVIITSAVPAGINAFTPSVLWSFKSITTRWGFWRKPHKQTFKEAVFSMMHLIPKEDQIKFYKQMVYDSGRTTSEVGFWYLDPQKASNVDETNITCPMLIIGAGKDRITPASTSRKLAQKYKQAEYLEYQNHAHWILHEKNWEEVAKDILKWLKKHTL